MSPSIQHLLLALVLPGLIQTAEAATTRSAKAKADFKRQQPCPATGKARGACPGYVVDHVVPLCAGGADAPTNMQWQTTQDAKAKDRLELQQCRRR
jgi:hypothetical protein